jgi:hypothetical protein
MLKKIMFFGGIWIFSCALFLSPSLSFAANFFIQYPGAAFLPTNDTYNYYRSTGNGYICNTGSAGSYVCAVNFPAGVLYVKGMDIGFCHKTDDYMIVKLRRRHLGTGDIQTVATFTSPTTASTSDYKLEYVNSNPGYKYIDPAKYVYYLEVFFSADAGLHLILFQVRIKYGTY